jgi:hypothetical protein
MLMLGAMIEIERKQKAPLHDPYQIYNEKATHSDRELVRESNESVDTMLVFVGAQNRIYLYLNCF